MTETAVTAPEPSGGFDSGVDPMAYDVLLDERMRDLLGSETGGEPPYDESDDT